jgi:hypothetical protein
MEIELTSTRDEGFTWRAAGARQPKGVVAQSLVPSGSKVGDVLRAEVEIEIDGITVVSVFPPKSKGAVDGLIEYIGPQRAEPGVTTVLATRNERRPRDRFSGDRAGASRPRDRDRGGSDSRRSDRLPGAGSRERQPQRPERADRPERSERTERPERSGDRTGARRREPVRTTSDRERSSPQRREGSSGPARTATRRGPARFEPKTTHRDELFARLGPEQRPIAEHLAAGGMPLVRKALSDEQARARTEGRPVVSVDQIIAIAEELLADVKAAVWLDRAENAVAHLDEISLRELRSTVVAASPRDEEGREIERQLREALDRRLAKLRSDWESHLTEALDGGKVLQALRLSAKPPEPAARFPAALVMRLAEQAGQAMNDEVPPERWLALLDAATQAPVRRQIKPAGIPKDPTGEVERRSRAASSKVPGLAKLLGMAIPPPPKPVAAERRERVRAVHPTPERASAPTAASEGEPVATSGDSVPEREPAPEPESASAPAEAEPGGETRQPEE